MAYFMEGHQDHKSCIIIITIICNHWEFHSSTEHAIKCCGMTVWKLNPGKYLRGIFYRFFLQYR